MSFVPSRIRLAFSILVLVSASAAYAAPKIGDSASLTGNLVGNGINAKVTTFQKILAYDANTDVYTVEQTQAIGNQPGQTQQAQVKGSDMLTEDTATQVVRQCESRGIGTKEQVTVANGSFHSCRVASDNGSILWIAAVPFGVVKLQTKVAVGTVSLEMSGFTHGN